MKTKKQENQEIKEQNKKEGDQKIGSEVKKLHEENKILQVRNKDLENKLKRALADYQNLEVRIDRQKQELADYFKKDIVVKFLPVLDNLERATKTINDQGLKIVVKQFHDILEAEGLKIVGQIGEEFDPFKHECIEVIEGNENKVVAVLEKGFALGEKVIRVAKVKVGKKS